MTYLSFFWREFGAGHSAQPSVMVAKKIVSTTELLRFYRESLDTKFVAEQDGGRQ